MVPTQLTNSATGEMGFSAVPDEIKAYIDSQLGELRARIRKIEDRFSNVFAKLPVSNGFSQGKIDSAKRLGIELTVNLVRKIFNSVNFSW